MMRRISQKASLSRMYTNHCVRATCITRLAECGVRDSMIMATSRHKSVQSLQSYQRPSEKQLQKTAALLDYESVHDDDIAEIDECLASATPQQLLELEQPGGKACFSMTPKQQPTASPKQQPSAAPVPMNFGGAHFEGCTIHLTVYYH